MALERGWTMEYKKLNNGIEIPMVGFGTWDVRGKEGVSCIRQAIDLGYRLIDTAIMYGNEKEVGQAVRSSGADRSELFVTDKINSPYASYEKTRKAVDHCLAETGLDYIDLILIHEPYGAYKEMYRALEEAYEAGKVRAIGISNINRRLYDALLKECRIQPVLNQVECHVYYPQLTYQKYLQDHGTVMQSWAPFTEGRRKIFDEPILKEIASAHGKTSAQIALKYLVQNGIPVIPKSSKASRMKENLDLFDFELSQSELSSIQKLDGGNSLFGWYGE